MKVTVTHVSVEAGDWEGIYVNDELKSQGHSHAVFHIIPLLKGYHIEDFYEFEVSDKWMEDETCGQLPDSLTDIPFSARL